MTKDDQRHRADLFRALHKSPPILVLPNVWDAVSARLYEVEGFKAVATTSAGVSATLGYPDGERMSLAEAIEVIRRIVGSITVPLSADLEAGYAESPDGVAESAQAAIHAGAVGINLEDSTGDESAPLHDVALQVEKIRAVRTMAESEGIRLVINARTDVYLLPTYKEADRLHLTIQRANAYRDAGADCIFVPDFGDLDPKTIGTLVKEIDAPLNVIAGEQTPPLPKLEELGVARVTFGPRPMRAALALIRKIAREWKEAGTYSEMLADTISYAEINQMLENPRTD